MSRVLSNERSIAILRILSRMAVVVAAIVAIDATVLGIFLYSQGGFQYVAFMASLILLMLLEGSLIVATGGFLFFSSKEDKVTEKKISNPPIAQEQQRKSKGMSRHQWAVSIMVTGFLLILIGFLTSALTQI